MNIDTYKNYGHEYKQINKQNKMYMHLYPVEKLKRR